MGARAGRTAERKGEAWLQTHQPEHPVIRAILGGDEEAFWRAEAAESALVGTTLDAATIDRAAEAALDGATPLAKNGYKVPLAKALVRRALEDVASPRP